MENNGNKLFEAIRGKLIVSCQALPEEPLHSSFIMGRMARAAALGGAAGIRANSVEDIRAIKQEVDLPLIGIIKQVYEGSDVFITPTMREVEMLFREGVDMIALDATDRIRPDGTTIEQVFPALRHNFGSQLFMADCATFEEAVRAAELGFDCVATTLSGYTVATRGKTLPDIAMAAELVKHVQVPVIAEGGIQTPEELSALLQAGVHAAVVGSAITRPMEITRRFVQAIESSMTKGTR